MPFSILPPFSVRANSFFKGRPHFGKACFGKQTGNHRTFSIGKNIINLFYAGKLFRCYMLDKSICHFRGVAFILFLMENPVSKQYRH